MVACSRSALPEIVLRHTAAAGVDEGYPAHAEGTVVFIKNWKLQVTGAGVHKVPHHHVSPTSAWLFPDLPDDGVAYDPVDMIIHITA